MELGENWHVNAPWAQLVVSTKMPDELFKLSLIHISEPTRPY